MPRCTENQIDELCARIRILSHAELTLQAETELRRLAHDLRMAIRYHVQFAKSSLGAKGAAIAARDVYDE